MTTTGTTGTTATTGTTETKPIGERMSDTMAAAGKAAAGSSNAEMHVLAGRPGGVH